MAREVPSLVVTPHATPPVSTTSSTASATLSSTSSAYSNIKPSTATDALPHMTLSRRVKQLSSDSSITRKSQLLSSRILTVGANADNLTFRGNSNSRSTSNPLNTIAHHLRLLLEYLGRFLVCIFFIWYAVNILLPAVEVVLENLKLIEDNDDDDISAASEMAHASVVSFLACSMLLACGMTLLGVRSGFRTLTVFMGLCGFTHGRLALALSCSAQMVMTLMNVSSRWMKADHISPALEPVLLGLNVSPFAVTILVAEFVRIPPANPWSSVVWFGVCVTVLLVTFAVLLIGSRVMVGGHALTAIMLTMLASWCLQEKKRRIDALILFVSAGCHALSVGGRLTAHDARGASYMSAGLVAQLERLFDTAFGRFAKLEIESFDLGPPDAEARSANLIPTLRFEPYHLVQQRHAQIVQKREQHKGKPLKIEEEASSKYIVVNGSSACIMQGEILNITNHPGNKIPKEYKYPTTMQRTYAYMSDKHLLSILEQASVVTTDHLSVDGILALYMLTQPKRAMPHYELLKDTAYAATYLQSTNPAAIQLCFALLNYIDDSASPLPRDVFKGTHAERTAKVTAAMLALIPSFFETPMLVSQMATRQWAVLQYTEYAFQQGWIDIQDDPELDLTIVRFIQLHPQLTYNDIQSPGFNLTIHNNTECYKTLVLFPGHYSLTYRAESYLDVTDCTAHMRRDLDPLAAFLQVEEDSRSSGAYWAFSGTCLMHDRESALTCDEMLACALRFFYSATNAELGDVPALLGSSAFMASSSFTASASSSTAGTSGKSHGAPASGTASATASSTTASTASMLAALATRSAAQSLLDSTEQTAAGDASADATKPLAVSVAGIKTVDNIDDLF